MYVRTNLILPPPKPLDITPRSFIHGIRVAQVRCSLEVLSSRDRVLVHAPAIAEAIRQLEDSQDKLALSRAAFLDASLERFRFD